MKPACLYCGEIDGEHAPRCQMVEGAVKQYSDLTKREHLPEPWKILTNQKQDMCVHGNSEHGVAGGWVCDIPYGDMGESNLANYQANAERITACVNALAGVPTKLLQQMNEITTLQGFGPGFLADIIDSYGAQDYFDRKQEEKDNG